jgi:hypothetical protein
VKQSLLVLAAVAILVAAVSASSRLSAAPATSSASREPGLLRLPPATPAGETTMWGHIKSLTHRGRRFEMRFDPAWLLHGSTASRAALEDTGSSDVPNDYYIVEEGHRSLTYVVPANAHVTVLDRGLRATPISVSELAQIVKGKNPKHRPLFDRANGLGFWIRVGYKYPNPVLSLDQQYQP